MGDEHGRALLQQDVEGGLDHRLGLQVEIGRGLVEHQDPGLGHEGPGQGDELALARGEGLPPLVHDGVEAVGESLRPARSDPSCCTASHTASSGAPGRAKEMLSRMVPAKRNGSWGTTPSWLRNERQRHVAQVVAVDEHPARPWGRRSG